LVADGSEGQIKKPEHLIDEGIPLP
jgi:hypothetical protein